MKTEQWKPVVGFDIRHCRGLITRGTLAEVFGVEPSHIYAVQSRRVWAHLQ